MPQNYFPSGLFLGELPDRGEFDVLREDFLLGLATVQTARAYKADLEDYWEWCVESGVDPLHPDLGELQAYVQALIEGDYARGTVRRRVAALRGFFDHLVAGGTLSASPTVGLVRP